MGDTKTILIVYAHQEPNSFNGALKDVAIETLESQGHHVLVSDLYEMGFNPSASKSSFKELSNPDHFNYQHELREALRAGSASDDVRAEVDKVLAADLVVLQTPMYWLGLPAILKGWIDSAAADLVVLQTPMNWLGLPAILKGWIDRCFADYVFFDVEKQQWFDAGPLRNKRAVLSMTTGGSAEYFSNKGVFGDLDVLLWPIQNALRFTGFNVLAPQMSFAACSATENQRTAMLQSWKERLTGSNIWTEEPLKFINIKHFDPDTGFQLTDKYVESALEGESIRTSGQNLGRSIPSGCMSEKEEKDANK